MKKPIAERIRIFIPVLVLCILFSGCTDNPKKTVESGVDYANRENWAYYEADATDKRTDVFFIAPTAFSGDEQTFNLSLDDEETKAKFLGATNMEKGIYDADARFFAPYYSQAGLNVYSMEVEKQEPYLQIAYADVKEAFEYYLANENGGRPIVLAGFSQGADLCIRLMKDYFKDEATSDLLIACYAIGWRITEQEIKENPHVRFATCEDDTGVIVAFNTEAEYVEDSFVVFDGMKALSINPLNWKTDGTVADKSLNAGACFTDYEGNIKQEIPNLTGAYVDGTRGTLKATDVNSTDYPPVLKFCTDGVYHLYDYQFFYRNLQENVKVRTDAFMNSHS